MLANLEFELIVDVPPDLPQICVDRPAMIQALDNIVDNAIKYSTTEQAPGRDGHGRRPRASR